MIRIALGVVRLVTAARCRHIVVKEEDGPNTEQIMSYQTRFDDNIVLLKWAGRYQSQSKCGDWSGWSAVLDCYGDDDDYYYYGHQQARDHRGGYRAPRDHNNGRGFIYITNGNCLNVCITACEEETGLGSEFEWTRRIYPIGLENR